MDHVVDFVLAVRGLRDSEFTDEDALMSAMMEVGAHESALQEGRRISLPLEGDLEADALTREQQRVAAGVGHFVNAAVHLGQPHGIVSPLAGRRRGGDAGVAAVAQNLVLVRVARHGPLLLRSLDDAEA